MDQRPDALTRSPNQVVGALLGVLYAGAGVVGVALALGMAIATDDTSMTVGVDAARAGVYLALGAVLAVAAARGVAKRTNGITGSAFMLLALAGPALGEAGAGLLALDHVDSVVHLLTAAVLVGFAWTQQ